MGKSIERIDWTDVATMISALQAFTGGEVLVTIEEGIDRYQPCLKLGVCLKAPILVGPGVPLYILADGEWREHGQYGLATIVYRLLQQIDVEYGRRYVQAEIFPESA